MIIKMENEFKLAVVHRRFHGCGCHLGSGANAAKFTVNVWEKIVFLMLDNSRKFDILQFL